MNRKYTLGIVGVRGYVGRELLALLADNKNIEVDWVSSRQLNGEPLLELLEQDENFCFSGVANEHYYKDILIENLSATDIVNKKTDIVVLALPNGLAEPFVLELERANNCQLIIDLSADYRFDNQWIYSVPELTELNLLNIDRPVKISNPGCYATAMQLALAPLLIDVKEQANIKGQANCFGISGYSGAGTKPSVNNDLVRLKDNILPYSLVGHLHEKEASYQLGIPVSFSPHVASFFRGISMTLQLELERKWSLLEIHELFETFYKNSPLIIVSESIPNIQQVVNTNKCAVGGFKLSDDGKRLSLVSCLDNLLKGAASQALQNICLALGIEF